MFLSTKLEELEACLKDNVLSWVNKKTLILVGLILISTFSLLFGIGYTLGQNSNPAPIIINQN